MGGGGTLQSVALFLQSYWIIPAGMLALYYYGKYHFDTPDYAIEQRSAGGAQVEGVRLLSLAPPSFTTSRARFRRYAWRYILILELAFLAFLFAPGLIASAGKLTSVALPQLAGEQLEYRALAALFALTGLLTSFPVFKEVDGWLLRNLHQAALIPDVARHTAARLADEKFLPSNEAKAAVRQTLQMRDTVRVADGAAVGTLELRLLRMRWLRHQLQRLTNDERYIRFRTKLDRDFNDIFKISKSMQDEVRAYFNDQTRILPEHVPDIDAYIEENFANPEVESLKIRRELLTAKCDELHHRLCLISALMVLSTEITAERISAKLQEIGFQVEVKLRPIEDWNAIFAITTAILALTLGWNIGFAIFFYWIDLQLPQFADRKSILAFALIETAGYAAALATAATLKKYWSTKSSPRLPENFVAAIASYLIVVALYGIMQYGMRGAIGLEPLLYAMNQAVVGFFLAVYVDRAVRKENVSWRLVGGQAGAQFIATLLGVGLIDLSVDLTKWAAVTILAAAESAIVACLIGLMFQHLYRKTLAGNRAVSGAGPRSSSAEVNIVPRRQDAAPGSP